MGCVDGGARRRRHVSAGRRLQLQREAVPRRDVRRQNLVDQLVLLDQALAPAERHQSRVGQHVSTLAIAHLAGNCCTDKSDDRSLFFAAMQAVERKLILHAESTVSRMRVQHTRRSVVLPNRRELHLQGRRLRAASCPRRAPHALCHGSLMLHGGSLGRTWRKTVRSAPNMRLTTCASLYRKSFQIMRDLFVASEEADGVSAERRVGGECHLKSPATALIRNMLPQPPLMSCGDEAAQRSITSIGMTHAAIRSGRQGSGLDPTSTARKCRSTAEPLQPATQPALAACVAQQRQVGCAAQPL